MCVHRCLLQMPKHCCTVSCDFLVSTQLHVKRCCSLASCTDHSGAPDTSSRQRLCHLQVTGAIALCSWYSASGRGHLSCDLYQLLVHIYKWIVFYSVRMYVSVCMASYYIMLAVDLQPPYLSRNVLWSCSKILICTSWHAAKRVWQLAGMLLRTYINGFAWFLVLLCHFNFTLLPSQDSNSTVTICNTFTMTEVFSWECTVFVAICIIKVCQLVAHGYSEEFLLFIWQKTWQSKWFSLVLSVLPCPWSFAFLASRLAVYGYTVSTLLRALCTTMYLVIYLPKNPVVTHGHACTVRPLHLPVESHWQQTGQSRSGRAVIVKSSSKLCYSISCWQLTCTVQLQPTSLCRDACKHCLAVCIVSARLSQSGQCVLITDSWSLVLSFKCCWLCIHLDSFYLWL